MKQFLNEGDRRLCKKDVRRFLMTGFRIFSAAVLCLSCIVFSGCADTEPKYSYYRSMVLEKLYEQDTLDVRLPGMTEGLCLPTDDTGFDAAFLSAKNAALFNDTDLTVLYSKKMTERLYPASMTKCMTALLAIEHFDDLDTEVTVTEEAFADITDHSSLAGIQAGDTLTVRDLLYALLVPSGNEAANVLAIAVSGSSSAFVGEMNARAKALGMFNTHYANPHGLHDAKHYTTAYDLYLLMHECLKYEEFTVPATTANVTVYGTRNGEAVSYDFTSGNSYIRGYTVLPDGLRITAAKTGYTVNAGRCLVMAVRGKDKKTYIGIVAGISTYDLLYEEMNQLMELCTEEEN